MILHFLVTLLLLNFCLPRDRQEKVTITWGCEAKLASSKKATSFHGFIKMAGIRSRSNSYGRNLHLLKGASPMTAPAANGSNDVFESPQTMSEQNKWLFEVAWEVANKG